jgi:hypothetical protein
MCACTLACQLLAAAVWLAQHKVLLLLLLLLLLLNPC